MSDEECAERWAPWTPQEVAARLGDITVPWGIAAGWAIDLHLGRVSRPHEDIEITVPAARFGAIVEALPGFEWDVVGAHRYWSFPDAVDVMHQTWLRTAATGRWHLDVFREPHDGDTYICRRNPAIRLPYDEVYARSADGIPYVVPELVLLFKAKTTRPKDQTDFDTVLPTLDDRQRVRLHRWLAATHPDHPWLAALP